MVQTPDTRCVKSPRATNRLPIAPIHDVGGLKAPRRHRREHEHAEEESESGLNRRRARATERLWVSEVCHSGRIDIVSGKRRSTGQELLAEAETRRYEAGRFRGAADIVGDPTIADSLRDKARELDDLAAALEREASEGRGQTASSDTRGTESAVQLRREADNFRRYAEAALRQAALNERRGLRASNLERDSAKAVLVELAAICNRMADEALEIARKLQRPARSRQARSRSNLS